MMTRTNHLKALAAALAVGLLLLLTAWPAQAGLQSSTFTVNSTGDGADLNLDDRGGTNACDTGQAEEGTECTLRAAIEEANHTSGANTINFNIDIDGIGSRVQTITPASPLPAITEKVTIDGYTQPGAKANTKADGTNALLNIVLDGTDAGTSSGLVFSGSGASSSVVKGLVINRFLHGIVLASGTTGIKVRGNFIGTDYNGTTDLGNAVSGVLIGSSQNTIGGTSLASRNLISGNGGAGVRLDDASGNKVLGNYIGTDYNGTTDLGNTFSGVYISGSGGGNTVGGANAGNTIAFNDQEGVSVVDNSAGNGILRNSIFSNASLGIDLGDDGRTDNDYAKHVFGIFYPHDSDGGPNSLQNFPILDSAKTTSGSTTIKGRLFSGPKRTFTLQFFSNPPGADEGKKYIGEKSVTTNPDGDAYFTFTTNQAVPGEAVTATATSPSGNTSEFSDPKTVG